MKIIPKMPASARVMFNGLVREEVSSWQSIREDLFAAELPDGWVVHIGSTPDSTPEHHTFQVQAFQESDDHTMLDSTTTDVDQAVRLIELFATFLDRSLADGEALGPATAKTMSAKWESWMASQKQLA